MNAVFVVALGGALGSVLRYLCGLWVEQPWATLTVNLLGSFLIGVCALYLASGENPLLRLLLVTGILGGFTTFSSFSLDSLQLLQLGEWGKALLYVSGNVVGGLLACWMGFLLAGLIR
ncbi:MAG: fluoride efflux transporter CrcB [Thiopseudomonas sp.]|jgi:CrcB protein